MGEAGRTALVTGASGFIGSHVVEELISSGWNVRCLVRPTSDLRWIPTSKVLLVHGSIGGTAGTGGGLEKAVEGASVVFHLAGLTSAASDSAYTEVNVGGTQRIIDAVRTSAPHAHVVFSSSLAAGGPARTGRPVKEDDEPHPVSAYGRSKLAAERLLSASAVLSTIVRPPAVYGPRDSDILAAFKLAARGLAMRVAPRDQRLSMVHAKDLARGLITAADAGIRGTFYMTDGVIHTWDEIMRDISSTVGKTTRTVYVPRATALAVAGIERLRGRLTGTKPLLTPDRARELCEADWTCDDTRARTELGYSSTIRLADGLRETAAWYRENGWLKT